MKARKYQDYIMEVLQDPEEAAGYLSAAIEDGDPQIFLICLRNVAKAQGGMVKLSRKSKLNRANLYKVLSRSGNPEVKTLSNILDAFGLQLSVTTKPKK